MATVIYDATTEAWDFDDAYVLADFIRQNGFHVVDNETATWYDMTNNHLFYYQEIHVI